jgi:hypothetical protein
VAWPVQPVGQPRADGGIHRVAVHPCQHPADGRLAGDVAAAGERVTAHPKRGQDRPGRISGPLGDRGHTPGAGRHRRSADGEHAGQGMPPSPPVTRVRDRRQPFQQARAFARNEQASMVKDGDGSGMGEDPAAGTVVRQVMRRLAAHGPVIPCLSHIHPVRPPSSAITAPDRRAGWRPAGSPLSSRAHPQCQAQARARRGCSQRSLTTLDHDSGDGPPASLDGYLPHRRTTPLPAQSQQSLLPRRALVPERQGHRPDGPAGTAASGARIARDYSRRGVLVGRSHS